MAVLRLARFTIDPADTEEMLSRRAAMIGAIRDAFPGLVETQLGKVDDQTWIDLWRWQSVGSAQAATAAASTIPQATAALALTKDLSIEHAELVEER